MSLSWMQYGMVCNIYLLQWQLFMLHWGWVKEGTYPLIASVNGVSHNRCGERGCIAQCGHRCSQVRPAWARSEAEQQPIDLEQVGGREQGVATVMTISFIPWKVCKVSGDCCGCLVPPHLFGSPYLRYTRSTCLAHWGFLPLQCLCVSDVSMK